MYLAIFTQTFHLLLQLAQHTMTPFSSDDNDYYEYNDDGEDSNNEADRDHQRIAIGRCNSNALMYIYFAQTQRTSKSVKYNNLNSNQDWIVQTAVSGLTPIEQHTLMYSCECKHSCTLLCKPGYTRVIYGSFPGIRG